MRNDQVSIELHKYRIISINLYFKVRDQFGKHFLEDSQLYIIVCSQYFDRDRFVDGQNLLNCWAIISYQDSCSLFELSLLEMGFGVLHQVGIQYFRTLFLSEV